MIAIRPPEYYPRLETVALMMVADTFVLADTFQYSRQSFQNRTKMRNPEGWQWVSVPLKGGQHGLPACDVHLRHVEGWKKKHWRAFTYNYRATPFFEFYEPTLRALFDQNWHHLADLTCATMLLTHRLFDLDTTILRASEMPGQPDDLATVFKLLDGDALIAPSESASVDAEQVDPVETLAFEHPRYRQAFDGFEAGMMALDLLFSYGPQARSIIRENIRPLS
jgi:hypothetical protein